MSDVRTRRRRRHGADRGLTLPELLITIVIIGIVGAVVTAGVSVTLRQHEATRGRVDVARWEQNLGMWLPDDLSSAATLDDAADFVPCGGTCGGVVMSAGSNVLGMSWDDGGSTTSVSYRYMPDGVSGAYGLFRVACTGGGCTSTRVLGDLSAPDAGWSPGVDDAPASVIDVDASLTNVTDDDGLTYAIGRRSLSVTVNGIPALDGVVRSSRVNVAAGGAELSTLEPAQYEGPSFVQARSDCGGPITLIVDHSGSIDDDMDEVIEGVVGFIEVLEGTPTQLQIIPFNTTSSVLDPYGTGEWNVYLDLSEPNVADDLIDEVDDLSATNLTNWEDAIYRTFYTAGGTSHAAAGNPAAPMPELVVFFTDGVPTVDRAQSRAWPGAASTLPLDPPGTEFDSTDTNPGPLRGLSPRGWWRTDQIIVRGNGGDATRLIGLGVGDAFGQSTNVPGWPNSPVANQKLLGDMIAGGAPFASESSYTLVSYDDGAWPDVSAADVLVASDFSAFASALQEIALGECGGTLTVQTRLTDGTSAPFNVTYQTEGEQVTTSKISKSGTFEIDLSGGTDRSISLFVDEADLASAGYTATDWTCMQAGVEFEPTLVEAGNPAAGIDLTISANGAVACTLIVTR